MQGKPISELKRSQTALIYEIAYSDQNEAFKELMHIVPSEILLGPNDKIPGLKSNTLPARFGGFDEHLRFSEKKTLYAHNIRITSMDQIEALFKQYLRNLCLKRNAQSNDSTVTAEVIERKLSIVPHNTWKQMGQEAMISLN